MKKDKTFQLYNEGVAFSLEANELMNTGEIEAGKKKLELSIEKFKETLQVNPNHKGALSAIGFSNFEIENYDEAINWFLKATKVDPEFALNYQFLGLSQINKGRVEEGEKNIEKAFELDDSEEMRTITIENLVDIGNLAYSYGNAYEKEGKIAQGNNYRRFGVRILISALEYSHFNKKIAIIIQEYAEKMNDDALQNWIREKVK